MFLSCFNVKSMFQVAGMFQYQWHVFVSSPCFRSRACFISTFLIYFKSIICFYDFMFLCFYVSLFPSIQKTFIQKLHRLFASFYVSCFMILTCVTFSLVAFLLFFTFLGYF
jgi:hypothetical protein